MGISIPSYVTWSNAKRFGKMLPYYWCDGSVVQQEALERIVRGVKDPVTGKHVGGAGYKHFGRSLRQSFVETESAYKGVLARDGSFFKYAGKTLRNLPGEIWNAAKSSSAAAKAAGKSGIWAGIKSGGGALMKRFPLVGSLLYLATEVPGIAKATWNGGLVDGAAEALKVGIKVTGFTAGAAIGQALIPIPFVGAVIGGMLGNKLGEIIAGTSYEEKQEEAQIAQNKGNGNGEKFDTGSTNPFNGGQMNQEEVMAQIQQIIDSNPELRTNA